MRAQLMGGPADGEVREIEEPAPPTLTVVGPGSLPPERIIDESETPATARMPLIEYTYQRGRPAGPTDGLRYHYHQERIGT